jgi:hypothetical protein
MCAKISPDVQILEHYADLALKRDDLELFILSCLDNTISEFKKIATGCLETLKSGLKRIKLQSNNSHYAHFLKLMAAAGVDFNDPEFHRRSSKFYLLLNMSAR